MTLRDLLLTLGCVVAIAFGQLLFKRAASSWPDPFSLASLLSNGWLLTALVIYGAATLGWVYILRTAPLNIAYPIFALAFLIVPVLSWLFHNESMRWTQLLGGAVIVLGVWLSAQTKL